MLIFDFSLENTMHRKGSRGNVVGNNVSRDITEDNPQQTAREISLHAKVIQSTTIRHSS